ncbi:MAG: hydrogenase maturation nickel metallochaperone HypA [Candidatus Sumerlaeota bacterium]|nr:hydrogenase maturation nickel metallochaperone HypA [Candidatus Sumerlaeota bacterium]
MHELSIIQSLIQTVEARLAEEKAARVRSIRIRLGEVFSEDAFRQAFDMLAQGTALEGARLEVESIEQRFACPGCGGESIVRHEDLLGHMFVCPRCGRVEEMAEHGDVEILEILAEE